MRFTGVRRRLQRAGFGALTWIALIGNCVGSTAAAEIRFEDMSSGIPEHVYDGGWEHFVGGGVAVFDCDQNGLADVFAAGGENPAMLLRNVGGFGFEPVSIEPITNVTGAYPIDIDADGWTDLYVMRVGPDVVLKGQAGCQFSDVTSQWGIPQTDRWTTSLTAWWEDDARPVIALGHYVDRANKDGPFGACDSNTILRPIPNGYDAHDLSPGFCALSMLAGPDARGRRTLRISNDRQYYVRDGQEQLWDIDEKRFLTEADGWPKVMLWGMGIASADLTGDGVDEVMLTSMGDQLMQLAMPDGTYIAAPFGIGTYAHRPHTGDDGRPSTGWHAQFGDINNDTRMDLFIAKGNVDQMPSNAMNDPNNLLVQNSDGRFHESAETAGVADFARSRGAALADFDNDGRLDLVVVNRRAAMRIYRNVGDTAHWLGVSLFQRGGNRDAIGAKVTVNGQIQHLRIGGGHAGGSALPLHFGLGDENIAVIQVVWPDGSITQTEVHGDQSLLIEKPDR
ncbi:Repeat domain-containing protein [Litoreibacter ascidiaceicola]|uniref:Repeat domain-containing protein n=2 Tax=Litoreibacter ascidiaceicola TaxID=1486859 RepID=A0A1M4X3P7_9RHOB|nr:Repeat domain-containing protein [Litoreibacter ascidiaceicola]